MSIVQVSASRCPSICERIIVSLFLAHYIRSSIFYRNEANWSENNSEYDNSILLFFFFISIIYTNNNWSAQTNGQFAWFDLCLLVTRHTRIVKYEEEWKKKWNQIESPAMDTKILIEIGQPSVANAVFSSFFRLDFLHFAFVVPRYVWFGVINKFFSGAYKLKRNEPPHKFFIENDLYELLKSIAFGFL